MGSGQRGGEQSASAAMDAGALWHLLQGVVTFCHARVWKHIARTRVRGGRLGAGGGEREGAVATSGGGTETHSRTQQNAAEQSRTQQSTAGHGRAQQSLAEQYRKGRSTTEKGRAAPEHGRQSTADQGRDAAEHGRTPTYTAESGRPPTS